MSKEEMNQGAVPAQISDEETSELWCLKYFRNECNALALCIFLLIFLSLLYLAVEASIDRDHRIQDCRIGDNKQVHCTTKTVKPWYNVIRFREVGFFKLEIDEAKLERFFAPAEITALKKRLQVEVTAMRKGLFEKRRDLLSELGRFMADRLSQENYLSVLRQKDLTVSMVENADLGMVLDWVKLQNTKIAQEHIGSYYNFVGRLESQIESERRALGFLNSQVTSLEPPLSFFWLYHPDYGWTFELIFWSWFGLLTNMIVALMAAAKENKYNPRAFVMGFPKFYIAPFLSLTMAAVWMTGFSKSEIYYYNMPYFLLFSFIVGFSSERIPNIIRELSKRVLGGMSWDDQKIKNLNKREAFVFSYQDLKLSDLPAAKTLSQAKAKAETLARAEARQSVIKTVAEGDEQ